jgi:hypothetical protein
MACARGPRCLHRNLGRQIQQGGRMPRQGSRCATGLIRFPGRTLVASAHDQGHRKLVRDRASPHRALQEIPFEQYHKTALAMIFKLAEAAEKSWRRVDGHNQLPKVILGVKFTDGIEVIRSRAQHR